MNAKKVIRMKNTLMGLIPEQIRHAIIRSALKIPDLPHGYSFEVARSRKDLDAAFSILYDAYHEAGITRSNKSRRRITKYHALPSTLILVAKFKSEVIATISIISDSFFGLPSDSIADFSKIRREGKRVAEISSLAVKKDFQGRSSVVHLYLSKYMFHCWFRYVKCNWAVFAVHPSRLDLYKALFMFKSFKSGYVQNYSFANNAPAKIGILNMDRLDFILKSAYRSKPYNQNIHSFLYAPVNKKEEKAMGFLDDMSIRNSENLLNMTLFDYCFKSGTEIMESMTAEEIQYLEEVYKTPILKVSAQIKRNFGPVRAGL